MRYVILRTTVGDQQTFQRHLEAHRRYLESLGQRRVLVLAGTFDDRSGGMLLVEAQGMEDAIAIAREDPLVQAGVDRYQVRAWTPTVSGGVPREDSQQMKLPLAHVDSGPITLPRSAENFRVVDVADHPDHKELLCHCLAHERNAKDDSARRAYLRHAGRHLTKLLLLHGEAVAGQIEFASSASSGLPVAGDRLTVINCLWVVDAYGGLGGGCMLLAACADRAPADSLATIACNATLPWLGRGFWERQGFVVVDEVETGRFFGNTPIVAYLLWRPLREGASPPTWDTAKLIDGLSFCPSYPWMAGKRLYWGGDYTFHGSLVREGLRRPEVLSVFPRLGNARVGNWTLVKIGVPETDLNRAVDLIRSALIDEPTYFAHLYSQERMVIVFPNRVFRVTRDSSTWNEAIQYGLRKGIPRQDLIFDPRVVERSFI